MNKFLIQTFKGKVQHDFSFTLLESIRYNNWLYGRSFFKTKFTNEELVPNCIPIGSVEFVTNYIEQFYGLKVRPKNIPTDLLWTDFLGRNVTISQKSQIKSFPCFVKSDTTIKKFTEIIHNEQELELVPAGDFYQISEVIDIDSEWRGFVYNQKLVGLQNYSGDFTLFPDVSQINRMIEDYEKQPIAYTIDVAVSNGKTVLIEVHDFFSCGLYGFANHKLLPFMFKNWFENFVFNEE